MHAMEAFPGAADIDELKQECLECARLAFKYYAAFNAMAVCLMALFRDEDSLPDEVLRSVPEPYRSEALHQSEQLCADRSFIRAVRADTSEDRIHNPTPGRLWMFCLPKVVFRAYDFDDDGTDPRSGKHAFAKDISEISPLSLSRRIDVGRQLMEVTEDAIYAAAKIVSLRMGYAHPIDPGLLTTAVEYAQNDHVTLSDELLSWLPNYIGIAIAKISIVNKGQARPSLVGIHMN